MSTPSERIFAHREDDDGVELRHFLPAQARQPMTLAQTADRITDGTALREAVADFVDDLRWARDENDITRRITEWPRYPGLWARAIVESPAAFRRRGILLGAGMLNRV